MGVFDEILSSCSPYTDGKLDIAKLGRLGAFAYHIFGGGRGGGIAPVGYQRSIPEYTAVRKPIQNSYDPNRRPGSGGRRYFTDIQYAAKPKSEPKTLEEAKAIVEEQAQQLSDAQNTMVSSDAAPVEGVASIAPPAPLPASGVINLLPVPTYTMASEFPAPAPVPTDAITLGGTLSQPTIVKAPILDVDPITDTFNKMAAGGLAGLKKGKYLDGATDGMADKIPATIDRTQPAALSDGEFVIPADVVSHLGNGNSDAGAKVLSKMMDRVRMARTGNKKQGKEIDPNQLLPA